MVYETQFSVGEWVIVEGPNGDDFKPLEVVIISIWIKGTQVLYEAEWRADKEFKSKYFYPFQIKKKEEEAE